MPNYRPQSMYPNCEIPPQFCCKGLGTCIKVEMCFGGDGFGTNMLNLSTSYVTLTTGYKLDNLLFPYTFVYNYGAPLPYSPNPNSTHLKLYIKCVDWLNDTTYDWTTAPDNCMAEEPSYFYINTYVDYDYHVSPLAFGRYPINQTGWGKWWSFGFAHIPDGNTSADKEIFRYSTNGNPQPWAYPPQNQEVISYDEDLQEMVILLWLKENNNNYYNPAGATWGGYLLRLTKQETGHCNTTTTSTTTTPAPTTTPSNPTTTTTSTTSTTTTPTPGCQLYIWNPETGEWELPDPLLNECGEGYESFPPDPDEDPGIFDGELRCADCVLIPTTTTTTTTSTTTTTTTTTTSTTTTPNPLWPCVYIWNADAGIWFFIGGLNCTTCPDSPDYPGEYNGQSTRLPCPPE